MLRPLAGVPDETPLLGRPDIVTLLTVFLALQFVIPSRLVLPALGAAGRPSSVWGLGLFLLYAMWVLHVRPATPRVRQPVRWVLGAYFLAHLLAYAAGYDRGLPTIESRSADRALLLMLSLLGVALATCDGVTTRRRLDVLLRRTTYFGAFMAGIGLIQALTGINPVQYVHIPGLSLNANLIGISSRGGLPRVAGTAAHYIELGVVSALLLPLAVHFLVVARAGRQRLASATVCLLLTGGIAFSLSRAALLGLGVALLVMAAGASWRWRVRTAIASALVAGTLVLTSSVWLETMVGLFTDSGEDPSIQNRLSDYSVVFGYFVERPWLGRGAGTFLPERYILLDNQYLGSLVSTGVVGLSTVLALLLVPIGVARWVAARTEGQDRHLAYALAAGLSVAFVTSATFDSFGFPTFAGVTFLLVGSVGALHRTSRDGPPRPVRDDGQLENRPGTAAPSLVREDA